MTIDHAKLSSAHNPMRALKPATSNTSQVREVEGPISAFVSVWGDVSYGQNGGSLTRLSEGFLAGIIWADRKIHSGEAVSSTAEKLERHLDEVCRQEGTASNTTRDLADKIASAFWDERETVTTGVAVALTRTMFPHVNEDDVIRHINWIIEKVHVEPGLIDENGSEELYQYSVRAWEMMGRVLQPDFRENLQRTSLADMLCDLANKRGRVLKIPSWGLYTLPALPPTIRMLEIGANHLTSLPGLPPQLTTLEIRGNYFSELLRLPPGLKTLRINGGSLSSLPDVLPEGLKTLEIRRTYLKHVRCLPSGIRHVDISSNQLTHLPDPQNLPTGPFYLNANTNELRNLQKGLLSLDKKATLILTNNPLAPDTLDWLNTAVKAPGYSGPQIKFEFTPGLRNAEIGPGSDLDAATLKNPGTRRMPENVHAIFTGVGRLFSPGTVVAAESSHATRPLETAEDDTKSNPDELLVDQRIIDFAKFREEKNLSGLPISGSINALKSYTKNIIKWQGKTVLEYEKHMKTSKRAWLNKIPENINPKNLAMHGTNLDAVLCAMKMGGQLLPVGNLIKRGQQLLAGEFGITSLNLRRVSTMPVYGGPRQFVSKPGQTETDGQLQFSAAVDGTRLYAYQAISAHLRVDHGQASHTPIVVIGDGADVQARGSSAVGIGIGGDIKGQKREIAFQRLNIRGLLCRSEDRDYVNEELEKLGVSVPVTTFDAIKKFRADWKGDLTAYKSLMETLVGRELEM